MFVLGYLLFSLSFLYFLNKITVIIEKIVAITITKQNVVGAIFHTESTRNKIAPIHIYRENANDMIHKIKNAILFINSSPYKIVFPSDSDGFYFVCDIFFAMVRNQSMSSSDVEDSMVTISPSFASLSILIPSIISAAVS